MSDLTITLTAALPTATAAGVIAVPVHFSLVAAMPTATVAGVINMPAAPTAFSLAASFPAATASGRLKRIGYGRQTSTYISYQACALLSKTLGLSYSAVPNPLNKTSSTYQNSTKLSTFFSISYDPLPLLNDQYRILYKLPETLSKANKDAWYYWHGINIDTQCGVVYGRIVDQDDIVMNQYVVPWYRCERIINATIAQFDGSSSISRQLMSDYQATPILNAHTSLPYESRASAVLQRAVSYHSSARLMCNTVVGYDANQVISQKHKVDYADFTILNTAISLQYGQALCADMCLSTSYDQANIAIEPLISHYRYTQSVANQTVSSYDLLNRDKSSLTTTAPVSFEMDIAAIFAMPANASVVTSKGVIDPMRLQVSTSLSENVWQVSADIAPNQLPLAVINDAVSVDISGITFAAVISGKSMNRSASAVTLSIDAFSMGRALSSTKAQPVTATNSSSALIALGIDRIIDLPSSPINAPNNDNQSVLSIASSIASDMGAVIISRPNGSLSVIPDYRPTGASWVVDESDILELQESFADGVGYNRIVVSDGASSTTRNVQTEVVNDGGNWLLYVYGIERASVTHTQSNATITPLGKQSITKTAQVEFIDGVASVTYPVQAIESVDWMANAAGTISIDGNQLRAGSTGSFGLANITYRVNPLGYRIAYHKNEPIQLIIKEF